MRQCRAARCDDRCDYERPSPNSCGWVSPGRWLPDMAGYGVGASGIDVTGAAGRLAATTERRITCARHRSLEPPPPHLEAASTAASHAVGVRRAAALASSPCTRQTSCKTVILRIMAVQKKLERDRTSSRTADLLFSTIWNATCFWLQNHASCMRAAGQRRSSSRPRGRRSMRPAYAAARRPARGAAEPAAASAGRQASPPAARPAAQHSPETPAMWAVQLSTTDFAVAFPRFCCLQRDQTSHEYAQAMCRCHSIGVFRRETALVSAQRRCAKQQA